MKKGAPDANGFYRFDEGHSSASKALADAGIPGIKYLDQGSRDAGKGTHNFVTFDDKHIEITHKNGEPVSRQQFLEERAAARAADARPHRQGRLSDDPGNDNRPSPADALDRDAAWRQLSHAVPDFDEPNAIAASNAAQEVKPPSTRLDERLTAAEKADAYAKQMYDLFAERLPEGDRQRLDDLIKTLDDDHEAHSIAIERGAACLFGARA